ncbi:MAG: hypothetical protein L3J47_08635 [Sulfurovum sp.]|nr:hypothetical protein [Sulfurovum sp.]
MIQKLLGINNASIGNKRNYYVYLTGAIFGFILIIAGIGGLVFRYSDTYQGTVMHQNDNIKYLKKLSHSLHDERLLNIAEQYKIDLNLIVDLYKNDSYMIILLGFLFVMNFILFNELRKKHLKSDENKTNEH